MPQRLRGWEAQRRDGAGNGEGGEGSEKRMKYKWKELTLARRTKIYCFRACSTSSSRRMSVAIRGTCADSGRERAEKASRTLERR